MLVKKLPVDLRFMNHPVLIKAAGVGIGSGGIKLSVKKLFGSAFECGCPVTGISGDLNNVQLQIITTDILEIIADAFFSIDEPSPTIRGVNRPVPQGYTRHPHDPECIDGLRPLTTQERAQVQIFPKDFVFKGTKTDLEQIIGNAVPVKLAEFVANRITDYCRTSEEKYSDALKVWLIEQKHLSPASAKDVISRINRVKTLTAITDIDSKIDIEYRLAKHEAFAGFSTSVKSQIKRAISLYFEFWESRAILFPVHQ